MRIVVIEPDVMSGKLLQVMLSDAGHKVVLTRTAEEAFKAVIGQETDAVLLDADLKGTDGYALAQELRAHRYNGPLIFVTERHEARDKLRAFESGADDYVVEPFHPSELVARLAAVSRRFSQSEYLGLGTVLRVYETQLSIGELTFRSNGGVPVLLTPTEMRILECLMRNSNIIISRETLIERVWGYDFTGDSNRVEVYIRRVRRKIERDPQNPEFIHTVRGIGYVFRVPDSKRNSQLKGPALPELLHQNGMDQSLAM